jgi:hypothetical protein
MPEPSKKNICKSICWLLIIALSGCTTTQTYSLNQVNSDLPIDIGDEVKIYEKSFGREYRIIVTEISEETIKGKLVVDPERITTARWEDIGRIELKQPDGSKTATLIVVIIGLLVFIAKSLADSLCDGPLKKSDDCN